MVQLLPSVCTWLMANENLAHCKVNTIVRYIGEDYIPQDLLESGRETTASFEEKS